LASSMNYKFPQAVATALKQLIPSAGAEGLTLMKDMMHWDPHRRPTAQQVGFSGNCDSSSTSISSYSCSISSAAVSSQLFDGLLVAVPKAPGETARGV